jgi:hypothetical protein
LVVSDRTTEKLELEIAQQGGALCFASEEAGTLFAIAGGRYSHDGAAQLDLFLKAYDRGEIDTARMTREAAQCSTPELSILVTPQPFLLRQLRERPEFSSSWLAAALLVLDAALVGREPVIRSARHTGHPDPLHVRRPRESPA